MCLRRWMVRSGMRCGRPLVLLAVAAILACSDEKVGSDEDYPLDSWCRFLPPDQRKGMEELAHDRFAVVPEAHQPEAQALLAANSHVLLSDEQARRYGLAARTGSDPGGVLVLLRGLETEKDESRLGDRDEFSVFWKDGTVEVEHDAARGRPTPQRRRAIVAVLPGEPLEVYTVALSAIWGIRF